MNYDDYKNTLHDLTIALLHGDAVKALEIYQQVADKYGITEADCLADEARLEVRLFSF